MDSSLSICAEVGGILSGISGMKKQVGYLGRSRSWGLGGTGIMWDVLEEEIGVICEKKMQMDYLGERV